MKVLRFRTQSQAILFERELQGQISDGQWENMRPHEHWKPWCNCEVEVKEPGTNELVGRTFYADYDRYNFVNKDLLSVVGERMLKYVRLGLAFGRDAVSILDALFDLEGKFRGMPKYEGEYWDRQREGIRNFISKDECISLGVNLGTIEKIAESDAVYDKKQLLADLKEMKQIVRTKI